MSKNLLTRGMRGGAKTISGISFAWDGDWYHVSGTATGDIGWRAYQTEDIPVKAGRKYTLSMDFDGDMPDGYNRCGLQRFTDVKNNVFTNIAVIYRDPLHATFTVPDGDYKMLQLWGPIIKGGATVDLRCRWMLVGGTTPAAWALAEGETLVGVGASMSANLLSGINPRLQYGSMADGVITSATPKDDWKDVATWPIATDMLAENQTFHIGISAKWHGAAATKGTVYAAVKYADAVGSTNNVDIQISGITTEWQRFSLSAVIPSGMHIVDFHISADHIDAAYDATAPTLSYGSPVVMASAEHTHHVPYTPVLYTYETDVPSKVELTYTDASFHDVGVLVPSSGDFAWGTDENDFSIDVYGSDLPERGGLLYAEGSDVGGVVRGFESETDNDLFSIVGDTWTGVLERHVIGPPSGSDYLTISGEARDCVAQVVALTGLTSLYVVDERRTGVTFTHTFTGSRDEAESDAGRYMGAWSAIWQMMLNHGLSVTFAWDGTAKKVRMVVGRRADRTSDEEQQAGVSKLGITQKDVTNHLICLGQGNLKERTRVDLYIDAKGNVSKTQTFKGLDELADVYDDSAAEDAAKLEEDGRKKFAEIWKDHEQITDTASKGLQLNLGDLVGGTDERSGISATAIISKRVLSFSDGVPSYTYTTTVRSK